MAEQKARFSLGLTYVPRLTGRSWWQGADAAEVRDELAHIADLGLDTVRLSLTWEEFQPSARRAGTRAMRVLELALDAAHAAGLRAVPLLFPAAVGGVLAIPGWANGASLIDELVGAGGLAPSAPAPQGGPPILHDGTYHGNQARDLYSYAPVVESQRWLVGEVVGYFASHPAVWAWQLGEGFERIHRPASDEAARAWYRSLSDAVRAERPRALTLGVTSIRGLRQKAGPRPESILEGCDMLGVTAEPPEPPGEARRHTTFAAFVHALAAGLAGAPAIVTSLGMPAGEHGGSWAAEEVYGRARQLFTADPERQALFVEAALGRLRQAGAAGAWLAAYADEPQGRWREPPLDRTPRLRALGVVDAAGREKPAAAALRAFAAGLGERELAPLPPAVDPERHWHRPAQSLEELWRDFEGER